MLRGKHIVLGICGGIAAYKAAEIASRLRKKGADVHCIMTENATKIITPLTLREITGNPVTVSMWSEITHWNVEHIALANLADAFLIAPATANIIGKMANGIADDMLSTTVMATKAKVILAPAMNSNMYTNPITQDNLKKLMSYGYVCIPPASGHLACGVTGVGRLPEPEEIVEFLELEIGKTDRLKGCNVLVTAGGTQEPIDPVRYIGNRSSGTMGYAIAKAAVLAGAKVTLVSAPTNLKAPSHVELVPVGDAREMQRAVEARYEKMDVVIKAAAVSDYRVSNPASQKIKKDEDTMDIVLQKNPDILYGLGQKKTHQILVGFAAETQQVIEYGFQKLKKKNLDMLVANDVSKEGAGFNVPTNIATLLYRDGHTEPLALMTKEELASIIIDRVSDIKEKQK